MTRSLPRAMRAALLIVLAIVVAWLGGLVWFGANMPGQPTKQTLRTDAIVVLTGGGGRLTEGGHLLTSGSADWLFVSGVNIGVAKPSILRLARITRPRLIGAVILGYRARNTRQNAQESADWVKKRGFTSIRLVTANYHMRRAALEFRRVLPEVRIVTHPVFPKPVNPGSWWRNMAAISVVAGEYNKYLVALVGGGKAFP